MRRCARPVYVYPPLLAASSMLSLACRDRRHHDVLQVERLVEFNDNAVKLKLRTRNTEVAADGRIVALGYSISADLDEPPQRGRTPTIAANIPVRRPELSREQEPFSNFAHLQS